MSFSRGNLFPPNFNVTTKNPAVSTKIYSKKKGMTFPLRFFGNFLRVDHSHPKIRLSKFSVSSIKAKRKVGSVFFKNVPAVMAIPTNKLFVWRQHDAAQTSASSTNKTNERFLQFALELPSVDGNASKRVYLKRPYDDPFSGFKGRLRQKVKDFLKLTTDDELTVSPINSEGHSSTAVDDIAVFKLFFNDAEPTRQCSILQIANMAYEVVRDPAWLEKVEISLHPLVGCPIFPSCDWKYTTDKVRFLWFLAHERLPLRLTVVNGRPLTQRVRLEPAEWEHVHTGPYYVPRMEDVGKFLAVVVDFDEGIAVGTVCPTTIAKVGSSGDQSDTADQRQEELIFERRQTECGGGQRLSNDSYRLLSYNILANLYLNLKKLAQQDLFFPYCPKRFLEASYRYPLILRELEGYNADLMFLQEVDFRMQKRFLIPFLHQKNFSTVFNCKENEVNEGLLIAFHNDRFYPLAPVADDAVEENFTVKLSTFLEEDPANLDIRSYLAHREKLRAILTSRPTILQLIRLRTKHDGRTVLCGNTHLFFDPAHEEVKILQTLLCLRYIDKVRAQLSRDSTSGPIQILFAGDLNSSPKSHAIALIGGAENCLSMKPDFETSLTPNCVVSMNIQAPFKSQCLTGFPDYTNFTCPVGTVNGFNGCLDYIWAHPPLRTDRIWPMPDHRLVTKYDALPSQIAPSDHLPILCEVSLVNSPNSEADCE